MSDIPVQQLRDDSATIRRLATERLDQLRDPVVALLTSIDSAITFMATRTAALDRQFALALPEHEHSAREVAKARLGKSMAAPRDRAASEASHAAAYLLERQAELVKQDSTKNAAAAARVAGRVLEAAGALETEVAKLALASGPIGAATRAASSATLQELLGEQRVIAMLESQTVAELREFWRAQTRVDAKAAEKIEPLLGRIARDRSREEWIKDQHRGRVKTPRDGVYSGEMVAARLLLAELEAAREARLPPDLQTYTSEIKPMLGSLLRRTIGVDPRTAAPKDLELYIQKWRPGARLDDLPVIDGWPLRYRAVAAATPQPLAPMPARFDAAG